MNRLCEVGLTGRSPIWRIFLIQDNHPRPSRSQLRALKAEVVNVLFGPRRCLAIPVVSYRFVQEAGFPAWSLSDCEISRMHRLRPWRARHT
jgi:hypothetical protein